MRLAWFGGEPLYNAQVIDLICNDLVERGIGYESSMISNGFLFDEKLIKRAAELWRLRQIQITLDGTEGVYNGPSSATLTLARRAPTRWCSQTSGVCLARASA